MLNTKNNKEFLEESINYMNKTNIQHRKKRGQYFTPKTVREYLLSKLPKKINPKILDPSCGSGEFLLSAEKYFKSPNLYGFEIEKQLCLLSKKIVNSNILNCDALLLNPKPIFDFVIGNPPYFEFKPSKNIKKKYFDIINGRANIFSMFLKLGLQFLKPNGYLAFVIPPSMNNGAYFSKLREYIIKNSNIENISILKDNDLFHSAQQTVMILVLKKTKNTGKFIFQKDHIKIFSENYKFLDEKFKNSYSLKELGYSVKTGTITWNQNKEFLTDNSKNNIPLLWAHNILENKLFFPKKKDKKPQYIKIKNYDKGPAIIVNRITGAASKAQIKAALIPNDFKFVGENHVNIIYKNKQELLNLFENNFPNISLEEIHTQLTSKETLKIMQNITGNTQISKTELEYLFPVKV